MNKKVVLTKKQLEEAWEMYKNGNSTRSIAESLKTTRSIIEERLKEHYPNDYGIIKRKKPADITEEQYNTISDEDIAKVIDFYERDITVKQTAKILNLKTTLINRVLDEKVLPTLFNLSPLVEFDDPIDHEYIDEMNRFL